MNYGNFTVIQPKYKVGHVFYEARSYPDNGREKITYLDEAYYRDIPGFRPVVKKRKIVGILAEYIENEDMANLNIKYRVDEADDPGRHLFKIYTEEDLDRTFQTEGEARAMAEEYAIHKKQEYYG